MEMEIESVCLRNKGHTYVANHAAFMRWYTLWDGAIEEIRIWFACENQI